MIRLRESVKSPWIPAFAGMTIKGGSEAAKQEHEQATATINIKSNIKMGSSFRWNDGGVVCRHESARALRAWVPAFAGMTRERAPQPRSDVMLQRVTRDTRRVRRDASRIPHTRIPAYPIPDSRFPIPDSRFTNGEWRMANGECHLTSNACPEPITPPDPPTPHPPPAHPPHLPAPRPR